ncbi:MFS transporter [Propioniciclava soli]|uniref:MFS transporter n=1 Tax=Propioniciclava soli TaxID=2775081 RepID=A0ABZ3C7V8_9ACTN
MSSPVPSPRGVESPADNPSTYLEGPARQKLVWSILISSTALFACYLAAGSVLLPIQVENLDPANRETNLAIVTSLSSFATLFVQPIVGALSDRTRSRLGRRAPWMLGGAVLGGIMLTLIPHIGVNVALVAVMWVLAQVSLNSVQGPMSALVADRLAPTYRGTASAFFGVGMTLGTMVGVVGAGFMVTQLGLGYAVFGIAVIVLVGLLVFLNQDQSSKGMALPAFSWLEFAKGFGRPFRSADFRWAFAQRFVMFLSYMGIVGYMLYILTGYVGLTTEEAGPIMALQQMVNSGFAIAATFLAGPLSDKLGRRKIFVFVAPFFVAVGCVFPILMPNVMGILFLAAFAGIGFGAYMAVDVALVVDILPNPEEAAKDLGVINIANNVPQMFAPIVNAVLIANIGYVALFPWAIVLAIFAAFLVFPIKGVR